MSEEVNLEYVLKQRTESSVFTFVCENKATEPFI